jgi:hypothetical protein
MNKKKIFCILCFVCLYTPLFACCEFCHEDLKSLNKMEFKSCSNKNKVTEYCDTQSFNNECEEVLQEPVEPEIMEQSPEELYEAPIKEVGGRSIYQDAAETCSYNEEMLFKDEPRYSCSCQDWQIMIKQGFFFPHDNWLKLMLSSGCRRPGGYLIEGAVRYRLCKQLFAELRGSWFQHVGHSIVQILSTTTDASTTLPASTNLYFGEKMCYRLPTLGLGLKYFWDLFGDCLNIFGGAGVNVFFMRSMNSCQGCCAYESRNCVGGCVGGGLQFKPLCNLVFELFADYLIKTLQPQKTSPCGYSCKINLGGLVTGVGIGCKF